MRRLIEVSIRRKGLFSKKAVAEIAVFILGLTPGTRANVNDSPATTLLLAKCGVY